MSDQPTPQQASVGDAIQDFRNQHNAALIEGGHPEHDRRVRELTQLFETRFAEPTGFDPVQGTERPLNTPLDEVAEEAMQPLAAEEYEIGTADKFGLNVDQSVYGWDSDLEVGAREVFSNASLNQNEALTVAQCYADTLPGTFDREKSTQASVEALRHQYGDGNVDRALSGTNRMLRDVAGGQLYNFIGKSGLGTHPRFVAAAAAFAKKRGYF